MSNYFWKQIKQQSNKQSTPTLAGLYRQIVENNNVALYSKDIGNSTDIPPAPEGIDKVTVVPKEYLNKIKSLAGLQNNENKNILGDLFKNKAGISEKFHKVLVPVIKNAIEASGYDNAAELLIQAKNLNGFFDIFNSESYNAVQAVMQGIREKAPNLIDSGLESFFLNIIPDTTKYASTNVGPGELFFVLFSNASAAGSSGQKSGDLQANGAEIELKASGARMGGGPGNWSNMAAGNIKKFLKSKNSVYAESGFFNIEKNSLCEKINENLNQSVDVTEFLQKSKQLIEKEETHSYVARLFERSLFKVLSDLLSSNPGIDWNTLVVKGSGKIAQRAGGVQLRFFVYNRLREIQEAPLGKEASLDISQEIPNKSQTNLAYLLANTFQILKKLKTDSITKEDVIKIISFANSYSEEECNRFGYSIEEDLNNYFEGRSVLDILNISSGAITNIVGGMHLCSYAQEKKFNKLMFINKSNGNVLVFDAPMSFQEGLNICRRPDINPDTNVDEFYGATCKYILKI